MKTRRILVLTVLAVAGRTHAATHPNFVFIMADDCTFHDIGCYGGQALTPRIDVLAREGMRFTRCFQMTAMCSPTRHNIYTGLSPFRSGAYPNHTFVTPGTKSIVHYLQPAGYRVALSGKKHIAPPDSFPFEYSGKTNLDMQAVDSLLKDCAQSDTTFCLFACSNEPHAPWNKGDASAYDAAQLILPLYFADTPQTRADFRRYLAEIGWFDRQIGEILDLLDQHELSENTLVMMVSEQRAGFPFGKWTCYEPGLQSACIVRWPGHVPASSFRDAMVEYVDILPTFLQAAGVEIPDDLDGESFLPVLLGRRFEHKQYVFGQMTTRGIIHSPDYFGIRSIRSAHYKYIWNFTPEITFQNACTYSATFRSWQQAAASGNADAAEKVRRYQHRPAVELYDIENDPLEWKNLTNDPDLAEVKTDLRRRLEAWMQKYGDKGQLSELAAHQHQKPYLRQLREQQAAEPAHP